MFWKHTRFCLYISQHQSPSKTGHQSAGFSQQNPRTARLKKDGGRWGVVPASEHQGILVALASLIRAQRYEMALTILDNELGGGC